MDLGNENNHFVNDMIYLEMLRNDFFGVIFEPQNWPLNTYG